jgi:hypothetical protein
MRQELGEKVFRQIAVRLFASSERISYTCMAD